MLSLRTLSLLLALSMPAGALTVPHLAGTTEIKTTPKRIVVLEFGFMDALAKLGVKPVGIAADGDTAADVLPHLRKYYGPALPTVGNRHSPSLERILALKPDLIIADENDHRTIYPQLGRIAPTLLLRSYRGTYKDQLDQFGLISKIVGKEALGKAVLADHTRLFAKVKATSSPKAGKMVVGVLTPNGFYVHSDRSYVGSLLEALGRDNPTRMRDDQTQYQLSLEGLSALNPDTLVVLYNAEHQAAFDRFKAEPLVQALPAGKHNRVYTFNRDLWAKGRGVIGLEHILSDMFSSRVLSGKAAR
ncbi:ABC transporter substrate-binding protein [Deinococcus deserti]|uniref:Putative ABC transporter, periplasmic component n=1 Tax=Deinococcus deserti (strain DSM 17065 / CIP 109153 / LMG 22923 / VCD115) TaxID=546414 RepID=C1CZH4_DEIDV|nr:ABC transporter substrate-binding protein [Deinococcus deserti]ACO47222.2 putative ABC transporter, periplasmic component [Deinococcus deserti VCD115]